MDFPINIYRDTLVDSSGLRVSMVKFDPPSLIAKIGDNVFWSNNDSEPHWPGLKKADGSIDRFCFMPNQIAGGGDSSLTFSLGVEEKLDYVCSLHYSSGQRCFEVGEIIVEK